MTITRRCSSPGSSPIGAVRSVSPAARSPGLRAWDDELTREQALALARQIAAAGVPYVAFGGGEPLGTPHCWEVFELLAGGGVA